MGNHKKLFDQLHDKKGFIKLISHEFGLKPLSIRNNWFAGYYAIPDQYQSRVIELLQNAIINQHNGNRTHEK